MPIQVIRYENDTRPEWGVLRDTQITRIDADLGTTADLVRHAASVDLSSSTGASLDVDEVRLLSPITRNQQLVCQGANYRSHMLESGVDPDQKTFNMFFRKASSSIAPADADVIRPAHVALLDYEIELGLVVKRDITGPLHLRAADLHEWIAGVTIINDISARDVQIPQMQFYKGKSFRTFAPIGPVLCLMSPDEMRYLADLHLELRVNGEVRQSASTSELVHGPLETLSELSALQDLHAGDLIATGTPAGCALRIPSIVAQRVSAVLPERLRWRLFHRMQERRTQYLSPGDFVESTIASPDGVIDLGTQRNRIVAASG